MSAAREHVKPSLKNAGIPATRALVTATTSLAMSSVRGPTTAAIINRNSGAKLTQIHCRPSSPSGKLSPASSVSRRVLARDEVPHLVELHLGHRQIPQQVSVDRFGLVGRTPEPGQDGLFGDPEHKADPRQINTDQEHLEGHHDLLFRGAEVEKDRLARLRKLRLTGVTAKDTSLAALGEIRRDSTHVTRMSFGYNEHTRDWGTVGPSLWVFAWVNPPCSVMWQSHYSRRIGLFQNTKG